MEGTPAPIQLAQGPKLVMAIQINTSRVKPPLISFNEFDPVRICLVLNDPTDDQGLLRRFGDSSRSLSFCRAYMWNRL